MTSTQTHDDAECDFDVIVVGAGLAGSVCATALARAGHEVALVERGERPGSKNLSGGVFYCSGLLELFPDFLEQAPIERRITRNNLAALTPTGRVGLDVYDRRLADGNAVSVLRSRLDPWLAEQAEEAGVAVVPEMLVDRLILEGGRVKGIAIGDEELRCRVVVAADGINSFVARSVGLRPRIPNSHMAVGVKSVIELGEERVRERFQLTGDEGAAWALVGDATRGLAGGGFMYTNRSSVSVGVVLRLDDLTASKLTSVDVHDAFCAHPGIAPYLEGGELKEYGCHMTTEGVFRPREGLVGPGIVVVGDAAGLTLNTGFAIRGMDLAVGSALAAARAIGTALDEGDVSAAGLSRYGDELDAGFVGADLDTYAGAADFLRNRELYGDLGATAQDFFYRVYRHDGTAHPALARIARDTWAASGLKAGRLTRIALQAVRSL